MIQSCLSLSHAKKLFLIANPPMPSRLKQKGIVSSTVFRASDSTHGFVLPTVPMVSCCWPAPFKALDDSDENIPPGP